MFLEKLSEFAGQMALPPPMYQSTPIRYTIILDAHGKFKRIDEDTNEKNKRGSLFIAPHCKRANAIKPKLLVDNAEYTLGLARETSHPERVQAQHEAYVAQICECAKETMESSVEAVARFLELLDIDSITKEKPDLDPADNITFRIDGIYPFEQDAVKNYWAKKAAATSDSGQTMQCLVCGEMRPPVERLPIVIKGIPGGQSTGLTLISANAAAFESYGLIASLIAPTCEVCGERFGNALNELLRKDNTHMVIPPLAYISWVKDPSAQVNIPAFLRAEPEQIKNLYRAVRRGKASSTNIDATAFYAATLSASGARVVLRDWIETSVQAAQQHLARFFWLQRIQDNEGNLRYFPLYILINATTNQNSKEKPVALVGEALMHVALHGGQLPSWLMYKAIQRIRASRKVQSEQAALIKMVLLSQQDILITDYEGNYTMTTVNEEDKQTAYLCGRLLAQLDYIQHRALGKVNATIVDRFYGTASTSPAVVFPRLLKGAMPHLASIRSERNSPSKSYSASLSYPDKELAKLLENLTSFPSILTLEEQGRFALGFYHQRAKYISQGLNNASNALDTNLGSNDTDDNTEAPDSEKE